MKLSSQAIKSSQRHWDAQYTPPYQNSKALQRSTCGKLFSKAKSNLGDLLRKTLRKQQPTQLLMQALPISSEDFIS